MWHYISFHYNLYFFSDIHIHWRRKWQPTSSTLAWKILWTEKPGRLWGHKESDMTERLPFHFLIYNIIMCYVASFVSSSLDSSPPGPSVHGILQARILEWVAMPSSRGSSQLRDQTWVSCLHLQADSLPLSTREAHVTLIPRKIPCCLYHIF